MWYNRGCGHDFEKSRLSQARWLFRTAAPLVRTGAIFDNNHLLQKNVLCFQVFALCPLVSTTRVFLLIESASNIHGSAHIKVSQDKPRGFIPPRICLVSLGLDSKPKIFASLSLLPPQPHSWQGPASLCLCTRGGQKTIVRVCRNTRC